MDSYLAIEQICRSVNMAHQTVFAMCAYNAKSGVVVDLGERMDVVPVVDGYKVSSGNVYPVL